MYNARYYDQYTRCTGISYNAIVCVDKTNLPSWAVSMDCFRFQNEYYYSTPVVRAVVGRSDYQNAQFSVYGDFYATNSLSTSGTKPRVVKTNSFGKRQLCAYETPTPMFGDIGDGKIDTDGKAYIFIDPIFSETVCMELQYQVFLQKYGVGDCYVSERKEWYFIVEGTPGLIFGWEIKAKQIDFDQMRLDLYELPDERVIIPTHTNIGDNGSDFVLKYYEEIEE
jgi:hypothetical protein